MSSKCEKNFPVCSDNIDVDVTNFPASTKEECKKDYHKDEDKKYDKYVKAKVLRKVAEAKITQPLTDSIFIPESFFSIKRITRRVVITQCFVVPEKKEHDYYKHGYYDHDECNAQLFVEGFILKNVEYATPSAGQTPPPPCDENCLAMRNTYNDLTAKVKFSFSVPIKLEDADLAEHVKDKETAILKECMKPCDEGSMSESDCERLHYQSVELQEPFTCELDKYQISEAVISKTSCNTTNRDLFDTVVEKLTLKLDISIFQLQTKKIEIHHDK